MWEKIHSVDWNRLNHAYGRATDMPEILRNMIAPDKDLQHKGWDSFWGAINHQGDYYDSTVAAIPFLLEAVAEPNIPHRARILGYFRDRWLQAPDYGGDPLVPEPPGGIDIPTPLVADQEVTVVSSTSHANAEQGDDEEVDVSSYRQMDLCAWQCGRSIQSGRSTFIRLLEDPENEVVVAAAALLLLWPETRPLGKQALIRAIATEANPIEQAAAILEFGVYAANDDLDTLREWIGERQPPIMRAAAALVWAWLVQPEPLPEAVIAVLRETSVPSSDVFANMPRVGVYQHSPWVLPANAAELILWLAENQDKEVRWRAVQGMALHHETAKHLSAAQVVPLLLRRLLDDYNRIRVAAALALAERGQAVLEVEPKAVGVLIQALEAHQSRDWGDQYGGLDADSSLSGHAARLLAALSHRLTSEQRQAALAGFDRAIHRYEGQANEYVRFHNMGTQAAPYFKKQRSLLSQPTEWSFANLLEVFAFPNKKDIPLSLQECDRRLADAYARSPEETVAEAIQAVQVPRERNVAIGAANWLVTLGPKAEAALPALDGIANGQLDNHAKTEALMASKLIRQSLLVTPEETGNPPKGTPTPRQQIARLVLAAKESSPEKPARASLFPQLLGFLEHADPYVRARAAEGLQMLATTNQIAIAVPALQRLLAEEAFAYVGIFGEFECGGRLFHWRQERISPRLAAIQALWVMTEIHDDRMLKAMLAESLHARVLCGRSSVPNQFRIDHWRKAVAAAGGLATADPLIRTARHQCRTQAWSTSNSPYVCVAELSEVIRQLSGRLI